MPLCMDPVAFGTEPQTGSPPNRQRNEPRAPVQERALRQDGAELWDAYEVWGLGVEPGAPCFLFLLRIPIYLGTMRAHHVGPLQLYSGISYINFGSIANTWGGDLYVGLFCFDGTPFWLVLFFSGKPKGHRVSPLWGCPIPKKETHL